MASPPTRPVLRARYERRRSEVIDVAARLFAERGYQATSISDLSAATGIAIGGLYHYFESKERLLIMILDRLMDPILATARGLIRDEVSSAEQKFRRLMRAWLENVEEHQPHMLVFQQERHVIERDAQWRHVRDQRRAFEEIVDELLAALNAGSGAPPGERRMVLLALLGMVNYTPQWFRPGGELNAEQIADGYTEIVLASLQRPLEQRAAGLS